ncbi:hypothetical protein E4U22_001721 [Claviceps purpurea]|nr:hypothetical protein E4U22_001721 [Claviceps purpurea]
MNSVFLTYPRQPNSSLSPSYLHSPYHTTWSHCIAQAKLVFGDTQCAASSTSRHTSATPKYALGFSLDEQQETQQDADYDDIALSVTDNRAGSSCSSNFSCSSDLHAAMSMRNKATRQVMDSLSASTSGHGRPSTPTVPVQIPKRTHGDNAHHTKRPAMHSRRPHKHTHSPDAVSPSVAALLAMTDIPRPRTRRLVSRRAAAHGMTVHDLTNEQHVSEKTLTLSISNRGPLDLLLSPPEDLLDDDLSPTESNVGSLLTRTISADSVISLGGESCTTDICSSVETPQSISISAKRRHGLMRRSLEPVRSPPDATEEHPLATVDDKDLKLDELALPYVEHSEGGSSYPLLQPFKPLRSVFKSNLTASLRALKSAAKSLSSINFSSIPADDFLTRSILTMNPNVPYMDERRPPVTEEMPSAELRRYLNPTTSSHFDAPPPTRTAGAFPASIQLETYKIQRLRSPASPPRSPFISGKASPSSASAGQSASSNHQRSQRSPTTKPLPGMRQREVRENPDFIRIAVMEMAMRRRGKLDEHKPGRARWALPPRQPLTKPYEVGSNGVPTRWIPMVY